MAKQKVLTKTIDSFLFNGKVYVKFALKDKVRLCPFYCFMNAVIIFIFPNKKV